MAHSLIVISLMDVACVKVYGAQQAYSLMTYYPMGSFTTDMVLLPHYQDVCIQSLGMLSTLNHDLFTKIEMLSHLAHSTTNHKVQRRQIRDTVEHI